MPVYYQSNSIIITSNLAASKFDGKTSYRLVYRGPDEMGVTRSIKPTWGSAFQFIMTMWVSDD